jgi:hypothetical protein
MMVAVEMVMMVAVEVVMMASVEGTVGQLGRQSGREQATGGEGGIRTPDTVTRMPHFECGAFNHSATSPQVEGGRRAFDSALSIGRVRAKQGNRDA